MHRCFHAAAASTRSTSARYPTPPLSSLHSDPRPGTTWNCPPSPPNRPLQHDLDKAQQARLTSGLLTLYVYARSGGYMQARAVRKNRTLRSRCQIPDHQWPPVPDARSPVTSPSVNILLA
ncbi:hypothetical protein COCMIDRAFT_25663 [Bipolaris oryzae ATCC 44560]|uniref:Uncharacterized protein n=1 Tax=Bipolaris oryzae ATCC 44560 TaxID=930090 RepID=W6ZRC5_COCMI|nr:uncharacterized protein COCMIDRAFT_25663 [Bipolaris oryzae ATCC 44560]EUC46231.1 hypothetical protein COCMIDRAFT_25663 [Bipolaris oryzae ATCC 44560]